MKNISHKNIIVIEDDPGIAGLLQIILEQKGYNVSISSDGAIDDKKINNDNVDLILLDYWLPKQNGDQVAKYLKTKKTTKNIPIIMMSASNEVADIAKRAGVDDYIPKPFALDQMLTKVDKYIC